MLKAKEACLKATEGKPIFEIMPFAHQKVGIVTTGNEVYYGRIKVECGHKTGLLGSE